MHGAHWGLFALIGAIAVLFTASNYDQSGSNKIAGQLRSELKTAYSQRDRLENERTAVQEQAEQFFALATSLDEQLDSTQAELRTLKAERDRLKKELSSLHQDRTQLQQTVAGLQLERSQTRRNIEQLRQGLHQLLSQTESAAQVIAGPAPGFAQTDFEEMPAKPMPVTKRVMIIPTSTPATEGTYYANEPLNDVK